MQNKILTLLAACMLLITLTPKPAEAFVKFRTNYFSSPVKGTILYDGEPVVGVEIRRKVTGGGLEGTEKFEDTAVTDNNGYFEMPEVVTKSYFFRPQLISGNPSAGNHINLTYKGEEYNIWASSKDNFEKGGEPETTLDELIITCELTNNDGKSERFNIYPVNCQLKGAVKK